MGTGLEEIRSLRRQDRRAGRRAWMLLLAALVASLLLLTCCRGRGLGFVSPVEAVRDVAVFLRLQAARLFTPSLYERGAAEALGRTFYVEVMTRFRSALLLAASGAVLALSGTVYQAAMRNAMAVPTMLGVSSGVSLAQIILLLQFGEAVYSMTRTRYLYSYGIAAAVLLIVLLGGKVAGGKNASVADMLIVGTIVNRGISIVVNYLRSEMDTDMLTLYQEFSEKAYDSFNSFSNLGVLCLVSMVTLLPIYLMRFSYNAVSYEDSDATAMGVRPGTMRVYGLVSGAILTTTAMIHCGNVGMLTLMVPHLCRYLFGADFRTLFYTSACFGGLLMLLSRIISSYVYLGSYQISVGSVISLLTMPVLVWAMLRQRRGWE